MDWRGPSVSPGRLPHFEIDYTTGGETVYRRAVQGSEGELLLEQLPDVRRGTFAYVGPFLDPGAQLAFCEKLAGSGARVGCGTYEAGIRAHRQTVHRVARACDYFFCNAREAELLFGSAREVATEPGRATFVTRGSLGARIVLGAHVAEIGAVEAGEVDPTGAGDTFCGTVLARIAAGDHPVVAARYGVVQAARVVTGIGPAALLAGDAAERPALQAPGRPKRRQGAAKLGRPSGSRLAAPRSRKGIGFDSDPRASLDQSRIRRVARRIASSSSVSAFDFTGPCFPEAGHPAALGFFFAATVQQFGFWTERAGRYEAPMIAPLDGVLRKGSDYLWAAYLRWLEDAPEALAPTGQSLVGDAEFDRRMSDDGGGNPLPARRLHASCARAYGSDMLALGLTPASLLEEVQEAERPLAAFLQRLDSIGGYKEDPLRKKSALLAAILNQRPERFLDFGSCGGSCEDVFEDVPPIVDYHCLRSCLRLGVVTVTDRELARKVAARRVVTADEEEAVRAACYEAVEQIRLLSGRSMGAVDAFFFQNRTRCPEMTEPDCGSCLADPACAHRTELFQPVFRTTAY